MKNIFSSLGPHTVENWLSILEKVDYCFRIVPFGSPKTRAVKKEKKLYLWDWSAQRQNAGAQFENLVASNEKKLSKHVTYFKARTAIPDFYQVHLGSKDYIAGKNVRVLPFIKFCNELGLV